MHCQRCDRTNRPDATFCDACGARLKNPADDHLVTPTYGKTPGVPGSFADGLFVGRQPEMEALQAALEDTLAGSGQPVMLVGEPGIGKTRMARELAEHAGKRGALVLWGRCHESPGAPPYWPWVQVTRSYVRERDAERVRTEMSTGAIDIAEIVSDVRELLPDLPTPPRLEDPEQARFRLFDSITTFLSNAACCQPLVLILDNLHWADQPSLRLLEFLAQALGKNRILVIGTYRDVEVSRQHPLSETLAELTREHPLQRLVLQGLSRPDVGRFIEHTAALTPSPDLIEAVHTQTEGNPLFMIEIVRLLAQDVAFATTQWQQHLPLGIGLPAGVREVIGKRLNRLSRICNQTLSIASVIGREFDFAVLHPLIDALSEEQMLQALEEAAAMRVIEELPQAVGRYQFTHALIRETLYDELTMARRVRLHRRIGDTLEELYGTNSEPHLAQLAHHFCQAVPGGNVDKAVAYARRAGARGMALLAYEEAVRFYRMAIEILECRAPMDEVQCCTLLLALGEAQWKAGSVSQALGTFQRAADLARSTRSPENLAYAALGFEKTSCCPGLPSDAAIRLLEEAERALGEGDSSLKAKVLGSMARALVFTGAAERSAALDQQAVAMARRLGDPSALIATLRTSLHPQYVCCEPENIEARLVAVTELIRLAKAINNQDLILEVCIWRFFDLMMRGDIPEVEAQLDLYTRLTEGVRQPFYLYISATFRAMQAVFEGRFGAGERLAEQAMAIGRRLKGQDVFGVFGMQMFTLRREQGQLHELAPVVRSFVRMHPETVTWRPGLALIYSELGLEQETRAEFEYLAANDFAAIPRDALWAACIAYLSEVCAFLRDSRRAATLYQFLTPYDGRNIVVGPTAACYGAASRYLGMLAATMCRWEDAQRHFEDALAMNAAMRARPWLAHTQHAYANMRLARGQAGDREQAVSLLNEALRSSRELGMHALAERAEGLLADCQAQPRRTRQYPCGLTQREVEVLGLVAAGKHNREIAETLFISANTVANHVRSILTKTNTANRTEAAAYAIHQDLLEM